MSRFGDCFDMATDMFEFLEAKKKRENFVSHNDKAAAVKLVDELLESKDPKDRVTKSLDKINKALVDSENEEKQASLLNSLVVQLAQSRDNHLIGQFLEHIKGIEGKEFWERAFHAFVLKLTCNDDWNTLDTVLNFGKGKEEELTSVIPGVNPIAIASEQVSHPSVHTIF